MPFELQPLHLLLIMVAALLIFGPQRLPEIGRGIGRAISEFRKGALGLADKSFDETSPGSVPAPNAPRAPEPGPASGNYCIHCGHPNPPAARFCNQCGAPLPA